MAICYTAFATRNITDRSIRKCPGTFEADETFVSGKLRNMHAGKRAARITGRGGNDKTAVMGILERGGKVRDFCGIEQEEKALQSEIRKLAEAGSALYTDFLLSYEGLDSDYAHKVVDHAVSC